MAGAVAAALLLSACSSDSKGGAAQAATTPTTAAPVAAPTTAAPATTEAPAPAADSPEAERVAAVRPSIDALIAALDKGDLAASQAALEEYDLGWNGIEVYVNMRSLGMYLKLEADLQADLEEGLSSDAPDFAALKAAAEELAARYDDAIETSEHGAPLDPLVDDVTTLRMIRADLRATTFALDRGDVAAAKEHFLKFKESFEATAEGMLGERNAANEVETEELVDSTAALFESSTNVEELTDAVSKVTSKYNFGVSLWNAAARAADDSRTEVTTNDLVHLGQLEDVKILTQKSINAWNAGDFERAKSISDSVVNTLWPRLQNTLATRNGADVALKRLIDAYGELAGAAGDAKEVGDAATAVINGATVAEHALIGPFWSQDKVQSYLESLPEAEPLT
jgi:hypothetical protein